MSHRVSRSLLASAVTAFLCLAGGSLAFGQLNERTEVMYWHAGSPLRFHVTWAENSFAAELNGKEILASQPGESGGVDEWVKLEPILKVGENTLTFSGLHEASASRALAPGALMSLWKARPRDVGPPSKTSAQRERSPPHGRLAACSTS